MRLLTTIAASLGTALENARLFDETQRLLKETEQRNAELAIINSIQQGLAAELDFQAIVDLVGDKLREVFATPDLGINWYDEKANLLHYLYAYEHGKRLSIAPRPPAPGGLFETMARTRQPQVLNTADMQGVSAIPGTDQSKSMIAVPIISSDRVLGMIGIENYERENAYGDSELRLLGTIAASLGTALQNARLFDETQRLFKAEQQRAAELAVINSIQQGMAEKLDFQAIIDLVGDKLREVFDTGDIGIRWYDPATNFAHYLYQYEHGVRQLDLPPTAFRPGGVRARMMATRQPVVITKSERGLSAGRWGSARNRCQPVFGDGADSRERPGPGFDHSRELRARGRLRRSGGATAQHRRGEHGCSAGKRAPVRRDAAFAQGDRAARRRAFHHQQRAGRPGSRSSTCRPSIDLVGDKLSRSAAFAATSIFACYDPATNQVFIPYLKDHGRRLTAPPMALAGVSKIVIESRQMWLANTDLERRMAEAGSRSIPGTQMEKSFVAVPIVAGDRVMGLVGVGDYENENAFSDSDVRLLQTVVSAMSVALENARLFDETQRLLKETERRAAELAVINSIQEGMAAELDFQAIIDLVGDKLREVFTYRRHRHPLARPGDESLHYLYQYEHGVRQTVAPQPASRGRTMGRPWCVRASRWYSTAPKMPPRSAAA